MREFKEFIAKGTIKKQEPNKSRAKGLIEESERKQNSLNQIIEKIGLTEDNANDIVEYCYDILISLARAKLYLDGFKSSGEGSHEAEVSYLIELGFSDSEAKFMDELRYFRNGIKYYGKRFSKEYAERVMGFIGKMLPRLKKKIVF